MSRTVVRTFKIQNFREIDRRKKGYCITNFVRNFCRLDKISTRQDHIISHA